MTTMAQPQATLNEGATALSAASPTEALATVESSSSAVATTTAAVSSSSAAAGSRPSTSTGRKPYEQRQHQHRHGGDRHHQQSYQQYQQQQQQQPHRGGGGRKKGTGGGVRGSSGGGGGGGANASSSKYYGGSGGSGISSPGVPTVPHQGGSGGSGAGQLQPPHQPPQASVSAPTKSGGGGGSGGGGRSKQRNPPVTSIGVPPPLAFAPIPAGLPMGAFVAPPPAPGMHARPNHLAVVGHHQHHLHATVANGEPPLMPPAAAALVGGAPLVLSPHLQAVQAPPLSPQQQPHSPSSHRAAAAAAAFGPAATPGVTAAVAGGTRRAPPPSMYHRPTNIEPVITPILPTPMQKHIPTQVFIQPAFSFQGQRPYAPVDLALLGEPIARDSSLYHVVVDTVAKWSGSYRNDQFPGMTPTCLSRMQIPHITPATHTVSVKLDGLRVFVLVLRGVVYLIDRKLSVYKLRSHYYYVAPHDPHYDGATELPPSDMRANNNSLLDGELIATVESNVPVTPERINYFFVTFDALWVLNKNVRQLNLFYRINQASYLFNMMHPLYGPSGPPTTSAPPGTASSPPPTITSTTTASAPDDGNKTTAATAAAEQQLTTSNSTTTAAESSAAVAEASSSSSSSSSSTTTTTTSTEVSDASKARPEALRNKQGLFRFGLQRYYTLEELERVLYYDAPMLRYSWDGLVFSPLMERYKPGYSLSVLKWKPINTVDFRLRVVLAGSAEQTEAFVQLLLLKQEELVFYDWISDIEGLVRAVLGAPLSKLATASSSQQVPTATPSTTTTTTAASGAEGDASAPATAIEQPSILDSAAVTAVISQLDGAIVECCWDTNSVTVIPMVESGPVGMVPGVVQPLLSRAVRYGGWKAVRASADRLVPNPDWIAQQTVAAISEGITREELVRAFSMPPMQ